CVGPLEVAPPVTEVEYHARAQRRVHRDDARAEVIRATPPVIDLESCRLAAASEVVAVGNVLVDVCGRKDSDRDEANNDPIAQCNLRAAPAPRALKEHRSAPSLAAYVRDKFEAIG